jgi:hypothetical protein
MKTAPLVAFSLLLLMTGQAGAGELQHELLVFGSAEAADTPGADEDETNVDSVKVAADVLFSVQRNSFKAFGEYLVTNHEADLERLQFGWEPSEHSVLWLGRFHQASSVWNHEHHHGQYLQTSVTRPAAEEWEDEGGIIPQHFLGVLWESSWPIDDAYRLHTAIGAGYAPVITPGGLEPIDVLKADASDHKLGVQARIAYQPRELEDTGIGLLLASNELGAHGAPLTEFGPFDQVDQTIAGVYAVEEWGPWKLHVTGYHVTTDFSGVMDGPKQSFLVGYLQVERTLSHGFEVFARHENTDDAGDNLYLQMFPKFVLRRTTLGARWQIARSHALSFEMSNSDSRTQSYSEFRLQWSAALL